MFLSPDEIRAEIEAGNLLIDPFCPELLKPSSYVLRLGDAWRRWEAGTEIISLWSPPNALSTPPLFTMSRIVLRQGEFVLGATLEKIALGPGLVGILSTLSHVARYGVSTNNNSLLVSAGFGMHTPTALTLELSSVNPSPIEIRSGMPICHLAFMRMSTSTDDRLPLTRSIYEGQIAPSSPQLYAEFAAILQVEE